MGVTWLEEGRRETPNSVPAISAHVTDYARWRLWDIVDVIGYDNVLYMDTDSIFIDAETFGLLRGALTSDVLGGLELRKEARELDIYGPRDYTIDGERHIAGIGEDWAEQSFGEFAATGWPTLNGLLEGVPLGRYPEYKRLILLKRRHASGLKLAGGLLRPPRFSLSRPPGGVPVTVPDPAIQRRVQAAEHGPPAGPDLV
jgi:hypothetical protein